MVWLLNSVYLLLLLAWSPVVAWRAWRHGKYREGWNQKLLGDLPRLTRLDRRPRIWLHAVSVGEVQLLRPVIQRLREALPGAELLLTTTTQTGQRLARQRYPELIVAYNPLDFSWAVRRALERWQPDLLVLAELELWPNWIAIANQRQIAVAIVNGRLGQRSARGYGRIRPLAARMLRGITWIGAQDESIAARFRELGAPAERVTITGSVKFDDAETHRDNPRTRLLAQWAGFSSADQVWVVGSTQDPEERIALEVFDQLADQWTSLKLVLVPRHPERFDEVARLLTTSRWAWSRRSQRTSVDPASPPRIVLVDTIGELAAWWGTASIGFVGGSLTRRGGQNMIEPAGYGVATSFGPHTHNFRDIVGLLTAADACCVVQDKHQLRAFVERCLGDDAYRAELGRRAAKVVATHRGATQRTVERLVALLGKQPTHPAAARRAIA